MIARSEPREGNLESPPLEIGGEEFNLGAGFRISDDSVIARRAPIWH